MKPVYFNDRKAPRMKKGKFSKMVITKDLHKRFIKKYPEYSNMTWDEFFDYWKDISQTIRTEAASNPLGVKLGGYNGLLRLGMSSNKRKAIDYKASQELGFVVNTPNILTKGRVARLLWERGEAEPYNEMLQFFAFEPTRPLDNEVSQYILNNPEKIRLLR